jgi:peptidoglycan/xylan/chitin deacetylase (PgdA/CDA1 family)
VLKRILLTGMGAMGAWSLARRLTRDVPRIFMLHRFSPEPRPRHTPAAEFGRLLDRISAECELLTMRDLLARLDVPTRAARPLAAITVDDGYADFYSVALPVLVERGLPATIFVSAGFVDGRCWLWWDALRFLIDAHPAGRISIRLPGQVFAPELAGKDSRELAWSSLADYLVTRNEDRALAIAQLEKSGGRPLPSLPPPEYAPMSWPQLRACEAAAMEIGGHSMTHAFLPALDSESLRCEIAQGRQLLEQYLDQPVSTFAYPNGMPYDWSPEVADAVRAAGFSAAVLAHPRPFDASDRYRLGRWSVACIDRRLDHILSGASVLKLSLRGA